MVRVKEQAPTRFVHAHGESPRRGSEESADELVVPLHLGVTARDRRRCRRDSFETRRAAATRLTRPVAKNAPAEIVHVGNNADHWSDGNAEELRGKDL